MDTALPQTGADLRDRRLRIGMSQYRLAKQLGISQVAVSKAERRERLQPATLVRYLEAIVVCEKETRRARRQQEQKLAYFEAQARELAEMAK